MQILPNLAGWTNVSNPVGLLAVPQAGSPGPLFADILDDRRGSASPLALDTPVTTPLSDAVPQSRQDAGFSSESAQTTLGQLLSAVSSAAQATSGATATNRQTTSASSAVQAAVGGKSARTEATKSTQLDAMRQVRMTREDFSRIRDKLEQAGVSKDLLDDIEKRIGDPQGFTWGQLVQSLRQDMTQRFAPAQELSLQDKQSLSQFLGRLGFDEKQCGELVHSLENGQTGQAWERISRKVNELSSDQTVTIGADEAQALAKALRLPTASQEKLFGLFNAVGDKELQPNVLGQVLQVVKEAMDEVHQAASQAMKSLREAVEPQMTQARLRVDTALRSDKDASQGRAVKASSLLAEPTAAAPPKETSGQQTEGQAQSAKPAQANQSVQDPALGAKQNGGGTGTQGQGKSAGQDGQLSQEKAWSEFFSKVRLAGDTQTTSDARLVQTATPQTAQAFLARAGDPGLAKASGSSFMDQVQSGILRNLGQGARQLTLELTPETLGRLNVMLTVKGQDVQAVIKAETPEAAKVLAENLAQLKQTLEQQGLTVSRLDVQTGLAQDSTLGQQWAGAEQHNQAREQQESMERLRNTRFMAGEDDGLVRDMQSTDGKVKNSQGGVDLIA